MKKYIPILLTVMLVISFSACEKEINVNLHSVPPIVVIEGIVKQDELAKVRVSQTVDFDDNNGYPDLEGAVVKITDDTGNEETLQQDASGWYVAGTLQGVIGRTYSLYVEYEGKEYTSTSKMPSRVAMDSLTLYKVPAMDWPLPVVYFTDPSAATDQYYRAVLFINGEQHPDLTETVWSNEFIKGSQGQFIAVFTTDEDNDPIKQGDHLTVEFQCIDKGAYTFFDSLSKIEDSQTNPDTNIKGGALGYFSACTTEEKAIVARWQE